MWMPNWREGKEGLVNLIEIKLRNVGNQVANCIHPCNLVLTVALCSYPVLL